MGVTAKEAEGERGGEQRTAASSSGSFRFRDVLEAEDASCLRGCCVDDVLRGPKPARVCVMSPTCQADESPDFNCRY